MPTAGIKHIYIHHFIPAADHIKSAVHCMEEDVAHCLLAWGGPSPSVPRLASLLPAVPTSSQPAEHRGASEAARGPSRWCQSPGCPIRRGSGKQAHAGGETSWGRRVGADSGAGTQPPLPSSPASLGNGSREWVSSA